MENHLHEEVVQRLLSILTQLQDLSPLEKARGQNGWRRYKAIEQLTQMAKDYALLTIASMEPSEILTNGQAIVHCSGSSKEVIEQWVQKAAQTTNTKLDWFYRAGHALVFCLGDSSERQRASDELRKSEAGIGNVRIVSAGLTARVDIPASVSENNGLAILTDNDLHVYSVGIPEDIAALLRSIQERRDALLPATLAIKKPVQDKENI